VELADVLTQAIADRSPLINATGQRWPDRPVVLEMSWHPGMQKLDLVIRAVDHLPPWHPAKQKASDSGDG
jgi:hypothetical protein